MVTVVHYVYFSSSIYRFELLYFMLREQRRMTCYFICDADIHNKILSVGAMGAHTPRRRGC